MAHSTSDLQIMLNIIVYRARFSSIRISHLLMEIMHIFQVEDTQPVEQRVPITERQKCHQKLYYVNYQAVFRRDGS
jgi:hypothetical protein